MMVKQVLATKNRFHRQSERQSLGQLRTLIVNPSTVVRYEKSVKAFLRWLHTENKGWPRNFGVLDLLASEFVDFLWSDGEGKAFASNFVAGIQHFQPSARKHLPSTWRLLGAWNRRELPARATPASEELVETLAGMALRDKLPDMAVLLCLGFHCLLRTGELLGLTAGDCDVDLPGLQAVLNLGLSKSGSRQGAKESVTVDDPVVVRLLAVLLLNKKPGDRLLSVSQATFRKKFADYIKELGLDDYDFKPYSLRRGGATAHFRHFGQLSRTVVRGRWASAKSARIYINDGLATLAKFKISPETKAMMHRFRNDF